MPVMMDEIQLELLLKQCVRNLYRHGADLFIATENHYSPFKNVNITAQFLYDKLPKHVFAAI
jgi:hypothetical protein